MDFFEIFQIFFQNDRKKIQIDLENFLGYIGDAEIHELSIAHVFRAIGSLLVPLKPNSRFFPLYAIFLGYIDSIWWIRCTVRPMLTAICQEECCIVDTAEGLMNESSKNKDLPSQ